ncbi:hypothetical protein [Bradyrhizobium sp.]
MWLLRTGVLAAALLSTAPSWAQDVGLVANSFTATYVPGTGTGPNCKSLLVTGQFLAPTPGYTLSVKKVEPQPSVTIYELELTATAPGGGVPQVLTPIPVHYFDPNFAACPYGVSVSYGKQRVIMGLQAASTAESR